MNKKKFQIPNHYVINILLLVAFTSITILASIGASLYSEEEIQDRFVNREIKRGRFNRGARMTRLIASLGGKTAIVCVCFLAMFGSFDYLRKEIVYYRRYRRRKYLYFLGLVDDMFDPYGQRNAIVELWSWIMKKKHLPYGYLKDKVLYKKVMTEEVPVDIEKALENRRQYEREKMIELIKKRKKIDQSDYKYIHIGYEFKCMRDQGNVEGLEDYIYDNHVLESITTNPYESKRLPPDLDPDSKFISTPPDKK